MRGVAGRLAGRCFAGTGAAGSTCPPTPSSASGTGWTGRCEAPARQRGPATRSSRGSGRPWSARTWQALVGGRWTVRTRRSSSSLSAVLPALSVVAAAAGVSSRAVDGWRYRVTWQPLRSAGRAALSGPGWWWCRERVRRTAPGWRRCGRAGASAVRTCARCRGLSRRRSEPRAALAEPDCGRRQLRVAACCRCWRWTRAHPDVRRRFRPGWRRRWRWCRRWATPGWRRRCGAVTRGAVSVGGCGPRWPDPAQALVWGLGRVGGAGAPRPLGRPGRPAGRCGRPGGSGWRACWPARRARTRSRSARRGVRPAAGPRPAAGAGDRAWAWRRAGTVLVTGGTGALGAHVARWLAARRAPSIWC